MKYNCTPCNYSTSNKFCYGKHLKTKKHGKTIQTDPEGTRLEPVWNLYQCRFCNITCSTSGSLSRHGKTCSVKKQIIANYKEQIGHLNITINEKEKEIEHLTNINCMLCTENKHLKGLVNNAGSIIKTSVSAMSYVIKHYKDAPPLEGLKEFAMIKDVQDDEDDENSDDNNFVQTLLYEQKNQHLDAYIGDFIIKTYKKEDPKEQSLWNSDSVRLTYIIRELINNKNTNWVVDKKGIKITQYIIDPLLDYIKNVVQDFILERATFHHFDEFDTKIEKLLEQLNISAQIIKSIDDKLLSNNINKYIAPYFYLSKSKKIEF